MLEKIKPQNRWEKEALARYEDGQRRRSWWTKISKKEWENDFLELTPVQKCLMISLKIYAGKKDTCFPSEKTLAKNLGISHLTVLRNIRILEKKGFFKKESQVGRFNIYYLKGVA
jgi:DNA-binding MarR family transcriptional regulator